MDYLRNKSIPHLVKYQEKLICENLRKNMKVTIQIGYGSPEVLQFQERRIKKSRSIGSDENGAK